MPLELDTSHPIIWGYPTARNEKKKVIHSCKFNCTFPEGMCKVKSLNIWTSGRCGYLKPTLLKLILPVTLSSVIPSSLLESIFDFLSRILKMDIAESLAFVASEASALACETPIDAKTKAKKTWKTSNQLVNDS